MQLDGAKSSHLDLRGRDNRARRLAARDVVGAGEPRKAARAARPLTKCGFTVVEQCDDNYTAVGSCRVQLNRCSQGPVTGELLAVVAPQQFPHGSRSVRLAAIALGDYCQCRRASAWNAIDVATELL